MTFRVIPMWTGPDGVLTGPIDYPAVRDEAAVEAQMQQAEGDCRRARGTDLRVHVVDAVSWRLLGRYRRKVAA